MENQFPREAWIILRVWYEPECWIGCYPENLYQQMVLNECGKMPRYFDSYTDADKYCKSNALIDPLIIPIAGVHAINLSENNEQLIANTI